LLPDLGQRSPLTPLPPSRFDFLIRDFRPGRVVDLLAVSRVRSEAGQQLPGLVVQLDFFDATEEFPLRLLLDHDFQHRRPSPAETTKA